MAEANSGHTVLEIRSLIKVPCAFLEVPGKNLLPVILMERI